ncbi:MAG: hypothetical protein J0I10_01215 [Verrucomicrobia bacterium]|nr:hypothetical protein [Verrucomicrobiota bacterium]
MKNLIFTFLAALMLTAFAACGPKTPDHSKGDGDGHEESEGEGEDGHGHGAEESGASFKEGKGIKLSDEARKALDISVAEVTSRRLNPSVKVTAQIYRTAKEVGGSSERSGYAYASAFMDGHVAKLLKPGEAISITVPSTPSTTVGGILKKVDTSLVASTDKAEIIAEIPDAENRLKMGEFVTVTLPETAGSEEVVAVPFAAVLDTAAGKFAYVQNGDFLLRTPVKTGPTTDDFVEITDGLYEGDTIAVTGAESLYLIELRATKGGGHSH